MNKKIISLKAKKNARTAKYFFPLIKEPQNCFSKCGLLDLRKKYLNAGFINEYQASNAFYGHSSVIRQYSSCKKTCPVSIEHGIYFGGENFSEIHRYDLPTVITFSYDRAKEIYKKTNKPAFSIGPYILYARSFLDRKDFISIKKQLGKVALVFPAHTVEKTSIEYESDKFISFIKEGTKSLGVNTVLVSSYFLDIANNLALYESSGMKVVCSGSRFEKSFLNRQRSLIELADYVFTNSVGTHIGYSVALNKPCSFFQQDSIRKFENENVKHVAAPNFETSRALEEKGRIVEAFRGLNTTISGQQYSLVDQFWGITQFRDPGFIRNVFKTSRLCLYGNKKIRNKANEDLLNMMEETFKR